VPPALAGVLAGYEPASSAEAGDLARLRDAAAEPGPGSPWDRRRAVHATASAVVVHPPTGRVLLRWHERMGSWLLVGGHGDEGEDVPYAVARREAEEETGLHDLAPWPEGVAPAPIHLAVVPVPAGKGEPAHEHADLRFVLATARPDQAVPERPSARLRWLPVADARAAVAEDNIRVTLDRVAALLGPLPPA